MGAVLVGQTSSRNSSMLLRQSPLKRDDVQLHTRSAKIVSSHDKNCVLPTNSIPVDSEALRELKRRVLVCLDNNATAEQVARSLVNDCPDWSSKLKNVSDVLSSCNNNNATSSSRKRLFDGTISQNPSDSSNSNGRSITTSSPRRRLSTSHADSSLKGASLQKQRLPGDISPIEVVTECFNLLDHLLSDIAQKDDEIARLQRLLDAAEQNSHVSERRLEYMKHYCHSNGIILGEMPTTSINIKTEPENIEEPAWNGSICYWKEVNNSEQHDKAYESESPHKPAATEKSMRSPRKCRRSSVELLTLPSIHNPATLPDADVGRSQSSDTCYGVMDKVRKRRASAVDQESNVPSKKSRISSHNRVKTDSETEEETTAVSKARVRKSRTGMLASPFFPSYLEPLSLGSSWAGGKAEEPGVLSDCMTTGVLYCYTDYEVMLARRDKEAEAVAARQASAKRIDTPGWRIAPVRGRTRAATHAAAQAALAAATEQSGAESGWTEPGHGEMPAEGSGFEEWAALADEPFEARHLRQEQLEKRREKAELRAYREYQRHARLREAIDGAGMAVLGGVIPSSVPGTGGAGTSDGIVVDGGAVNGLRRGLPESLWPDANTLDAADIRDCRIFYYSQDCIPVVAFGRLVPPRQKKPHGFSLPWARRSR